MKKIIAFIFVLVASSTLAQNQFHMGQYMIHQPFMNPAAIGSYENLNITAFYKNQWTGFDGAPEVRGLNINTPLRNNKIFLGLTVVNDIIGISNANEISGTFAYKLRTGSKSRLVFGTSASLNLVQSNYADLHIHDVNDPIYASNTPTVAMPNFKFGAYYYRKRLYVGLAIPNILENKVIVTGGAKGETSFNFENIHYYLHGGYRFTLSESIDLNMSTLIKEVQGSPVQADLNAQMLWNKKLGIGASYRSSKELLGMLTFNLSEQFMLSYGYEFNFAELGNYSSGTHEILFRYMYKPPLQPVVSIPRF